MVRLDHPRQTWVVHPCRIWSPLLILNVNFTQTQGSVYYSGRRDPTVSNPNTSTKLVTYIVLIYHIISETHKNNILLVLRLKESIFLGVTPLKILIGNTAQGSYVIYITIKTQRFMYICIRIFVCMFRID